MQRIRKNQRHVRWNWEESPDNEYDGNPMVRYHLVVVDDRNRDGIVRKFLGELDKVRGGQIKIRRREGKVKDTDYRFLFVSYDSSVSPEMVDWSNVKKKVIRDKELWERKDSSDGIEDYVNRLYEG